MSALGQSEVFGCGLQVRSCRIDVVDVVAGSSAIARERSLPPIWLAVRVTARNQTAEATLLFLRCLRRRDFFFQAGLLCRPHGRLVLRCRLWRSNHRARYRRAAVLDGGFHNTGELRTWLSCYFEVLFRLKFRNRDRCCCRHFSGRIAGVIAERAEVFLDNPRKIVRQPRTLARAVEETLSTVFF